MVEVTERGQEVLDALEQKVLPVIVYLHGAGERIMPKGMLEEISLSNYVSGPVIFVTPHRPLGETWEPDAIKVLMERVLEQYPADPTRLYLTGHSMGARGAWDTICEYPNMFAAAVPLAGYTSYLRAERIAHMPIWAFHGVNDPIVPYIESKKMIDALRSEGNNAAKLTPLKADHSIAHYVYNQIKVFRWMMEQKNERFNTSN